MFGRPHSKTHSLKGDATASKNLEQGDVQVGAAAGGAELARGWMHKWRGKFPRRWEWRLFLLQQGAGLRYFRDSPGGHLQLRGEIDVRTLELRDKLPSEDLNKDTDHHFRQGTTMVMQGLQPNKTNRPRVWILRCASVEAKLAWEDVVVREKARLSQCTSGLDSPSLAPRDTPPPSPADHPGEDGCVSPKQSVVRAGGAGPSSSGNKPAPPSCPSPSSSARHHSRTSSFSSLCSLESLEESLGSLVEDPTAVAIRRRKASWSGKESGLNTALQAAWSLPLQQGMIVKCGWLLKQQDHTHMGGRRWQRRLFVIRTDFLVKYYAEEEKNGTLVEHGEFQVGEIEFLDDSHLSKGNPVLTFEAFQTNKGRRRRFCVAASPDIGLLDPLCEILEWRKVLEKERLIFKDPSHAHTRRCMLVDRAKRSAPQCSRLRHRKAMSVDLDMEGLLSQTGGGKPPGHVRRRWQNLEDLLREQGHVLQTSNLCPGRHKKNIHHRRTCSDLVESTFESLDDEEFQQGSFLKLADQSRHEQLDAPRRSGSSEALFQLTKMYSLGRAPLKSPLRVDLLKDMSHNSVVQTNSAPTSPVSTRLKNSESLSTQAVYGNQSDTPTSNANHPEVIASTCTRHGFTGMVDVGDEEPTSSDQSRTFCGEYHPACASSESMDKVVPEDALPCQSSLKISADHNSHIKTEVIQRTSK
mmetsp:Transcript_27213/g.51813  ORF Transcript_27213/g.51813 Transcript_27213/m.51813 type:complete len:693 (-) Transcript_27213:113-2191(-)